MKKYFTEIFIITGILFLLTATTLIPGALYAAATTDRKPVFAGSFYPASQSELTRLLKDYFDHAGVVLKNNPQAILVPHAGYMYSGEVAAAGFRQIDPNSSFKHVFILASSHTSYFRGASLYTEGDFITPLGTVKVDTLAGWLVKKYDFLNEDPRYHAREHSIEVQLPFLQHWLKKPFSIIPVVIGGESVETCRQLAAALEPYFSRDNLFIISTDFSHYPKYEDANLSDSLMAEAVLTNSSQLFLKAKRSAESGKTANLETAMCGWSSVLTLLDITEKHSEYYYQKITHRNSGDSKYGEKNRVVGYYAIGLSEKKTPGNEFFTLTKDDKHQLLSIARKSMEEYVKTKRITPVNISQLSPNLLVPAGAFVTLTENGRLRGCIGIFQPDEPLYRVVQSMAIASATEDSRFEPVTPSELKNLKIEISVLTPMKKIKNIEEIELGKHGIYLKKGNRSGTFLPQVATDTKWTKEEFLGHCAQDKAFIGWKGWKDADIYIYEALVFDE